MRKKRPTSEPPDSSRLSGRMVQRGQYQTPTPIPGTEELGRINGIRTTVIDPSGLPKPVKAAAEDPYLT